MVFDVDKIDKALHKAAEKVMDVTPLVEKTPKWSSWKNRDWNSQPLPSRCQDLWNSKCRRARTPWSQRVCTSWGVYHLSDTKGFWALKSDRHINFSIHKLLNKDQAVVNENANKDSDVFNTQRDLTAGIVGKSIGLQMLPKHVANAHQKGDIHYHDLDYSPYTPMTNCCLIDFKGMLENGFKIGNAEVESPKSIQTATAQIFTNHC